MGFPAPRNGNRRRACPRLRGKPGDHGRSREVTRGNENVAVSSLVTATWPGSGHGDHCRIAEPPNRRGAAQWGGRDVGAGSRGAGRHFDSERAQSTPSLFGHVPRSRPVPLQAKMGRSRPAPAPQRERHKSASLPAAPERAAGPARASTPASGQGCGCVGRSRTRVRPRLIRAARRNQKPHRLDRQ